MDFLAIIRNAGRSDEEKVRRFGAHEILSPDYDLHFATRGRGEIQVGGSTYAMDAGDLLLVRPGERFRVGLVDRVRFERIFIHFDLFPIPGGNAKALASLFGRVRRVRSQGHPEWRTLCLRALRDFRHGGEGASRLAHLHLTELLALLLEAGPGVKTAASPQGARGGKNREALLRAEQLLRDRFREKFTLAGLASQAGLSVNHFTRLFRAHTGRTPIEYQIERKIEHAKLLLIEGGRTVEAIARELGLESAHHLSVLFKRKTGQSPTAYGAKFRAEEGSLQ